MDAVTHWDAICRVFGKTMKTTGFCAMATVNPDGSPHIAPIGSLILHAPGQACYFEKFPVTMRRNLDRDPRVCVLAAYGGFLGTLAALFRGRQTGGERHDDLHDHRHRAHQTEHAA